MYIILPHPRHLKRGMSLGFVIDDADTKACRIIVIVEESVIANTRSVLHT